jgi:two-component system, LytTR family, response regulator
MNTASGGPFNVGGHPRPGMIRPNSIACGGAGSNLAHMIRLLVADDEPLARARLRELVADDPELEIVGECGNGADAVTAIGRLHPDLVLLDIHMPELDGLEVVRRVGIDRMPVVVFVTAHEQYAVRAFDVRAVDYVLKPVDDKRFAEVLQRAKQQVHARARARSG